MMVFHRMLESSKPVFAIAFCCDRYMELPLLVAATSAMRHISTNFDPHFYLMLSFFDEKRITRLRKVLDGVGRQYSLTILPPPDDAIFHGFRPFFGSYTAYYRLVLPDLIPGDRFLYLDSDTVTGIDLSRLAEIDMQGCAMGFVVHGRMGTALEWNFFFELGNGKDDPAFNSGVMLVDSKQWKAQRCFPRIMEFCGKYPNALLSADQTALNALFAKSCFRLDPLFNVRLSTIVRDDLPAEGVYHFMGSPKPWDIFGNLFHPYSRIWNKYRKSAGIDVLTLNPYVAPHAWWRLPRILGGYFRLVWGRLELMLSERS